MNDKQIVEALAALGLHPGATLEECQVAYRVLAKKNHPDLYTIGSPEHAAAVDRQTKVNAAYELLKKTDLSKLEAVPGIVMPKEVATTANWDAELDHGRKLEKDGHILAAAEVYKKLAQQGFAKAQFRLGYLYFDSVMKDMHHCFDWWKRAADQGHASAQFNLGLLYERGIHVPMDLTQAIFWYTEAAKQGDKQAAARLKAVMSSAPVVLPDNAKAPPAAPTEPPPAIIGRQRSASESEQAGKAFFSKRK